MKRSIQKVAILGISTIMLTSNLMAGDYDNHWAKEAIDRWQTYGMVKGYEDDTFRPNQTITRAEFATILSRVLNLPKAEGVPSFIDIMMNSDKWYADAVQRVTSLGLMYVEGMNFMPNQAITREEAAYAITKAYELTSEAGKESPFTDEALMSGWAVKSIQTLSSYNYIKGNPDGSFKPKGTLTRAELVTMLNNITAHLITQSGVYTQSVSGNVLVNTKGVTLKDMTIEGDLYLTQGIGSEIVTLDNVTVKGTVYINGGTVNMSGAFEEVKVASGLPIQLAKGNIKKLVINKANSILTVDKEAAVQELVENKFVDLAGEGTIQGAPITPTVPNGGIAGGGIAGQTQNIEITSAGIYINNEYVSLPVSDNGITLDIPELSRSFALTDEVNGLIIETSEQSVTLSSRTGSMQSGRKYTFEETEEALGIIREAALKAEVSPTVVINYILGGGQLTIGGLMEDFKTAMQNAAEMDVVIEDEYDFVRSMETSDGKIGSFTIKMCLK